jgi:hypothetical protein
MMKIEIINSSYGKDTLKGRLWVPNNSTSFPIWTFRDILITTLHDEFCMYFPLRAFRKEFRL